MPTLRPSRPTIREITTAILHPTALPHHPHFPLRTRVQTRNLQDRNLHTRPLHTTPPLRTPHLIPSTTTTTRKPNPPPRSHPPSTPNRGPSSAETTQTDFGLLDVLGNTPAPSTSIDACTWDGFHLNSGVKVTGGKGVLLVAGEAFAWSPWLCGDGTGKGDREGEGKRLLNSRGQWEVGDESWGILGLVWPKPDLLILGLGPSMAPLSPKTRAYINSLGIRVDIQDTRNASAQFNLLATERGVGNVAAALVPMGFKEGVGFKSMS